MTGQEDVRWRRTSPPNGGHAPHSPRRRARPAEGSLCSPIRRARTTTSSLLCTLISQRRRRDIETSMRPARVRDIRATLGSSKAYRSSSVTKTTASTGSRYRSPWRR
jgi:hypothetical protein